MKLKICDKVFEMSEGQKSYNDTHKIFVNSAIAAANKMESDYWKCRDLMTLVNNLGSFVEKVVANQCSLACKLLYENDVLTVTEEDFLEIYYDKYIDVETCFSNLVEKLEEIQSLDLQLSSELAMKQLSRGGSWRGGGNGIVGSIVGGITASVFNGIGNAFNHVSDSVRTVSNNAKVRSKMVTLYEDWNTCVQIQNAIFDIAYNALFAYIKALNEHGIVFGTGYQPKNARAMFSNALKYETDSEKRKNILIDCLFIYPYEADFYSVIRKNYADIDGLNEFEEYFSMKTLREFNELLSSKPILQNIKRMSEDTANTQIEKLRRYIEHEKRYNVVLSSEITKLLDKIKKDNSNNLLSTYTCINGLQTINDPKNRTTSLLEYFQSRKLVMEEEENKRKIHALPKETIEQKSIAITKWIDHSRRFNVNVHSQVSTLFIDIAKLITWEKDIDACLSVIKRYQHSEEVEMLEVAQKALRIKKNMLKSEEKVRVYAPWIVSDKLYSALRYAREGDAFYQTWFMNALYPTVLEDEIKSCSQTQRKEYADILDLIADIISFLFDRPEKYPFDLLMRLKFNTLEEDWKSVSECLESFCEKKNCVAGKFAYSQAVIKSDRTKSKEMLTIIADAADRGYYPAIKWLSEYYLPDEIQYVYYQLLLQGDNLWYNYIYERNVYDKLYHYSYLRLFHLLITKDIIGINSIVSALRTAWINQGFEIGSNIGINNETMNLARAKMHIKTKYLDSSTFFSIKNNDGQVFAFSNSGMYIYDENQDWYGIKLIEYVADTPPERSKWLPHYCELKASQLNIVWQTYLICYFATKQYVANIKEEYIEPMALCGNPYAICRVLVDDNTSDDRREVYERKFNGWKHAGKYFAVCPNCFNPRGVDDLFCPDCGTKVQ